MLTAEKIQAVLAETGDNFPKQVQLLEAVGVREFSYDVKTGNMLYRGGNFSPIFIASGREVLAPGQKPDQEKFQAYLAGHQQGESDFSTFRQQAALSGVAAWEVDLTAAKVTYYDVFGTVLLTEAIPGL